MKAELKTKWVEALRSGKYQQGKHSLRNHTGYCCLGVLADVVDPRWTLINPESQFPLYSWDKQIDSSKFNSSAYLVEDAILIELPMDQQGKLAAMNDDHFTFAEIADYIEANIKGE